MAVRWGTQKQGSGGGKQEHENPGPTSAQLPSAFAIAGIYPNPFNPATAIRYHVPASGGRVKLAVYSVNGEKVRDLVARYRSAGVYEVEWAGIDAQGNPVASGVYFVRMVAPDFDVTRKMVLLK